MCGKFTQMMSWQELVDLADIVGTDDAAPSTVTPMRFARVIRLNADGARESVAMRWGFSARNAKTPAKPDHIHARAETIDTRPTFRDAFHARRGILVVRTFNEGEDASPTKTIQHTLTPRDGKPLAIAALWEAWTHPEQGELLTFVMVTVPANRQIAAITDRMPAVLAPEDWATWLGEEPATPADLKSLLRTVDGDWDMAEEKKGAKRPPPEKPSPSKKAKPQGELF
ncbi:MAG: SOS response-associated peptidase [Rhizomicrobium sp.]